MSFITKAGKQTAAQTPFDNTGTPYTSTNVQDVIEEITVGGGTISSSSGSSTDNAVVRWDGVTASIIQNSNAILSDDGVLETLVTLQKNEIPSGVSVKVESDETLLIATELLISGELIAHGEVVFV